MLKNINRPMKMLDTIKIKLFGNCFKLGKVYVMIYHVVLIRKVLLIYLRPNSNLFPVKFSEWFEYLHYKDLMEKDLFV